MHAMWRWLTWQRVPATRIRITAPARETRWWLLFAVAYLGLSVLTGLLIRTWPMPLLGAWKLNHDIWYLVGFKITALGVIPVLILRRHGYGARDLLGEWSLNGRAVLWLGIAFAAGLALNIGHLDGIAIALGETSTSRAVLLIAAGLLVPLFSAGLPEEIVYRATLQTRLEATAGRRIAVVGTALLFTAWHIPPRFFLAAGVEGRAGDLGSVLLGTGVPVLIVGLFFGWAWDRYRSLPPLIALHWGIDILPAVSSFLGVRF